MPDLTSRLNEEDAVVGKKVDLVPRHGSVANMATRAATGTIVDMDICHSPDDILPKKARCGKGCVAIKVDCIHSPALILPRYRVDSTKEKATLRDVGKNHIIVPIAMLKEYVDSDAVRATAVEHPPGTAPRITQPTSFVETGNPFIQPDHRVRGKDKRKRKERECRLCSNNNCEFFNVCSGGTGRGACKFYESDGVPIICNLCEQYGGENKDICRGWSEKKRICHNFENNGSPK